ncbi:cell division protein CrgA [Saxibacter everestensis]|uniref:Cell division protein CrgA n=1 Tax=Saxibacter everestensis TaxID=2909229 RepID=A0ABY8QS56_9MICO|nr:cell division protein CrgA [Brevibacteriaceae bacterium ZFBP1038]
MPESKTRKKSAYTAPTASTSTKPNARWFLPVMLGILLLGLAWIITFYVSQGAFPVESWGNWNLLAGFAIIIVGFGMSTRWR